ncbi:restriction endonuclease [Campylobacter upsaliensis]|uniref:restriction endonuclease n=1 Tax=Campylobacter upsaliensis TaxID=28080 RepID=UPI00127A2656|nr:restriction endonuclease [Campylobacter upsaliensis]EAH8207456.1 restriction endonuclease [Campylobacter upsaliensis]EAI4617523.1 restriction endonuclease [Campylobacter upsaliensis]EAJ1955647.1 restriction endonuclease [Campylobacter upsaliensis]EAJ2869677.1 restriction endonuclease [Campylobacter upsaliensis]EAJ3012047.1 restriction endonuclease [Campylobacter upsaliensis]
MKSKMDLFLELAKPDEKGFSRWVGVDEFVGDYKDLQLGNGGSWCRASSNLAKTYILEFDKTRTSGNSIDAIRLQGFNPLKTFNQNIRKDIKDFYKSQKCVMLGVCGKSENTTIEIDHKDGRKDSMRVSELAMQEFEDFQPLCKAANDIKRQICKTCKETNTRWSAKNIKGNPYDFYAGDERYIAQSEGGLGCVGCYQYDPVAKKVREKSQKKQRILSVQNFMEMYELHRLKA